MYNQSASDKDLQRFKDFIESGPTPGFEAHRLNVNEALSALEIGDEFYSPQDGVLVLSGDAAGWCGSPDVAVVGISPEGLDPCMREAAKSGCGSISDLVFDGFLDHQPRAIVPFYDADGRPTDEIMWLASRIAGDSSIIRCDVMKGLDAIKDEVFQVQSRAYELDAKPYLRNIDLKGNIVLQRFGDTALLMRPGATYEPYVVAHGYDKATGEWSYGSYYGDLGHAFEEANPEIIEEACVRWHKDDIRAALSERGLEGTEFNISTVADKASMRGLRDVLTQRGNERIAETVENKVDELDPAGKEGRERERFASEPVGVDGKTVHDAAQRAIGEIDDPEW